MPSGHFDADRSAELVNGRMSPLTSPRLAEIMTAIVENLHRLVKQVRPTEQEWMEAISFLTRTGQTCTDTRQEFILLSDVLGVSMLVDALNHELPTAATPHTILGPFYVSGSPELANGANICLDGKGSAALVQGRVLTVGGDPLPDARVEVWQTNDDGFYDVQQPETQPQHNLRGSFRTDCEGRFWFRTVKPRYYPIPDDGPVGMLLRLMGRHPNRPAHIHFIITATGYQPLVTHLFPDDCRYLAEDAVFGVKDALVVPFEEVYSAEEAARNDMVLPFFRVAHDFALMGAEA